MVITPTTGKNNVIMKINQYIENLASMMPPADSISKYGLDTLPDDMVKNYRPDRRNDIQTISLDSGLFIELFNNYDLRYFSFGDFTFNYKITYKEKYYVFADSSHSQLAFETPESEVIEFDREEYSILNYCAKNTEAFLVACLPLFEMYSLRIQDLANVNDPIMNDRYYRKCVEEAGGERYARFFYDLIF